jgi:hypothetical protein
MRNGDPIPGASTTASFNPNPQNITNGVRREGCSMLDEWLDGAPRIEMKEDVAGLGHYGKTLTVLFTDAEVESVDPDEEEDSFDRWQRWETTSSLAASSVAASLTGRMGEKAFWPDVAKALVARRLDATTKKELSALAWSLDDERTAVLARMRHA